MRIGNDESLKLRFGALASMVLGLALLRLLPHPPNVAPVAAMALFGGARFDRRLTAFAVPLGAMLVSDLALEALFGHGMHALLPVVYLAFAAIVAMGYLLRRKTSVRWIAGMAVGASSLFFVATNFAVWMTSSLYPASFEGLVACYAAALPFFGNTLAGDLVYTGAVFGAWSLAQRRFPALSLSPARSVRVS